MDEPNPVDNIHNEQEDKRKTLPFFVKYLPIIPIFLVAIFFYIRHNTNVKITVPKAKITVPKKNFTVPKKNFTVPKANFTVSDLQMNLIFVWGGKFQMVSNDKRTIHTVIISKDFWIGKTEVTQAQYKAITGENPSKFKGDNLPVEQVTWHDAIKFCELLTTREIKAGRIPYGFKYTLPTEAQWEYAARGGNKNIGFRYSGSDNCDEVAWYNDNSSGKVHNVADKQANELGIYDMSGNVWEWCLDWYDWYASGEQIDPAGATNGVLRVARGGSWSYDFHCCGSVYRNGGCPSSKSNYLGFRVVLLPVHK